MATKNSAMDAMDMGKIMEEIARLQRQLDALTGAGKKPVRTRKIREDIAGKEYPARKKAPAHTSASASAPTPAKKAAEPAAKPAGLKVVRKFGTQLYLRVPRGDGKSVEVAHLNLKTKRGHCVATIHAKAERGDMGFVREFLVAYSDQLTLTAKLAAAGIKAAADVAKVSDAQLMRAFGC